MRPYQGWKSIPGVEVNEQVDCSDEAVRAVEGCRAEFWRLYRIAKESESKRVAKARKQGELAV